MKSFDLNNLVRENIKRMKSYSSARDEFKGTASVFLDANENPYAELYNRYPDPHQRKLKEKISALKNIPAHQIFLGNGSDEAIDLIFRAFCVPGKDKVIIPQPTYGMYSVSAETNDIQIITIPLTPDFDIDVDSILLSADSDSKILFLCSPNNPSGNLLSRSKIKTLLEKFDKLVVIDEAYIDFAGQPSLVEWLNDFPNLIILQTLSKAWGLAALRLGMCFASSGIIKILNRIKPPYNVNEATQQLVLENLKLVLQKEIWVRELIAQREVLKSLLEKVKVVLHVFPSDANFLLIKVTDAAFIYDYLIQRGIVVRDRSKVLLCEGCLRITVGTEKENQLLIKELSKL
jgi:histidinol-phosphate aminotransferase